MKDRIERIVELRVPAPRVWRALTDHREFGAWFRVALDQPFVAGETSTGSMTYPGFEGYPWLAVVVAIEPESLFAFRWHDYDAASGRAIAEQPTTLVEFRLEAVQEGSRLTITESGFEALTDSRRIDVMRDNTEGWAAQARNLAEHVGG